ncbi:MAG: glycosyltransferase family 2 protein [Candidatus Pacearchaeota archaeon]|jgi:glycosyltransferase involved in cell wall biosynthesis
MKLKNHRKTLTIVIPAYNEEKNIKDAVETVVSIVHDKFRDYEILIFNDCSKDKTGEIVDRLASKNNKIKVIHNPINKGLGYNYQAGMKMASKEYFTFFPGDNENSKEGFERALNKIGEADIIIPYTTNLEVRQLHRNIISSAYVWFMNFLFGLKLKYYNGNMVYRTKILKDINVTTYGFAYSAEILVKLIKKGYSYEEVGVTIKPTKKTSIFRLKNIISVFKTIIQLFYDVRIKGLFNGNKKVK